MCGSCVSMFLSLFLSVCIFICLGVYVCMFLCQSLFKAPSRPPYPYPPLGLVHGILKDAQGKGCLVSGKEMSWGFFPT